MDRKTFRSKPQHLVTNARNGEIERIVHPSDTDIGAPKAPADLRVFGSGSFDALQVAQSLYAVPMLAGGRLTLSSSNPFPTTNAISSSVLYYTPYESNQITLHTGDAWQICSFSEPSINLSGRMSSNKNYDVFAYVVNGSVQLELSTAWTSDSSRSSSLARVNGVLVSSANTTRRYLGTIRSTSANTTEDSTSRRLVWNNDNRRPRALSVTTTVDTWAYNSPNGVWRAVNSNANNSFQFVCGDAVALRATAKGEGYPTSTEGKAFVAVGIGIDSTTANSAQVIGGSGYGINLPSGRFGPCLAIYAGVVAAGNHQVYWIETGQSTINYTFVGDGGQPSMYQNGMVGEVEG